MINLIALGRAFGSKWAVSGLTLDVREGEIFGLLGPNGAGKTTTIRMMTGLLLPTEGALRICGHDIVQDPIAAKMNIGYVPDRAFLYEKLTVREFLVFSASLYDVTKADAMPRIDRLLNLLEIADTGETLIEACSQGMRQRLLFASALVHEPKALIIDEPFVGLDPFGVILIKGLIKDLAADGKAVFLATHSLHIAQELCDRVGLIDHGKLIAERSRAAILHAEGGLEGLFMKELGHGQ